MVQSSNYQLDDLDLDILLELKKDGKQSLGQLNRKLGVAKSSIYHRLTKLKNLGIIKNYTINVDYTKMGKPVIAFILITALTTQNERTQEEIAKEIASIPGVYEVHIITGEYDMIAKVRVETIELLGHMVVNKIRNVKGVGKTLSNVSLVSIREEKDIGFI
ncbi:MAG: Lrp/AsnC family transcriptional regulator [Candidatus Heimdallarchaeaceae archaeon]